MGQRQIAWSATGAVILIAAFVFQCVPASAQVRFPAVADDELDRTKRSSIPNSDCTRTSVGFTPLNDLAGGAYQGYEAGLYLGGTNDPPLDYRWMGWAHCNAVQPLDQNGQPNTNGRIVLLSIGMSNTTQEFSTFKSMADADPEKNPQLTIVDGAQGGQDAQIIRNPNAQFWTVVDQRLAASGVNPAQVQTAWLKQAIGGENRLFPADALGLRDALRDIVDIMQTRYPNIRIIYFGSRIYAGYATTTLNPEPYAFQSGFAVKWLIDEHINSSGNGAWLAWGPYLWADGLVPRSDGLTWLCSDFQNDGTHPSTAGRQKVAGLLLNFFKTNETAWPWFVRTSSARRRVP
jgi:hypothetical protein